MDPIQERFVSGSGLLRRHTKQAEQLVGPGNLIGFQIPRPTAELGLLLRFR